MQRFTLDRAPTPSEPPAASGVAVRSSEGSFADSAGVSCPGGLYERSRRRRGRRRQRGVALILVLSTLTVLTVMLTEFQDETSAELGSALTTRDAVRAEYAAKSAVNLSRLFIASEPTVRKAAGPLSMLMGNVQIPVWEYTDLVLGAFGDEEGAMAFQGLSGLNLAEGRNLGMEGAGFRVQVIDEDSKINFNVGARPDSFSRIRMAQQIASMIAPPQYNELFERLDDDGKLKDRSTVCSAIVDWVDSDQTMEPCEDQAQKQATAAEDTYYQFLDPPYRRKNAAFDSLEELHLVRGVDDVFWRTFVEPDPEDPAKRNVTVWGQGGVNVNTANAQTLLALVCQADPAAAICVDIEQQAKFLSGLSLVKAMMPGVPLFPNEGAFIDAVQGKGMVGPMLAAFGFEPLVIKDQGPLKKAIATESKVFSIYATGYVRSGKRETRTRIHAVVDFRAAPPPGQATLEAVNERLNPGGAQPPSEEDENQADSNADEASALIRPSPAGNIIYYRVE